MFSHQYSRRFQRHGEVAGRPANFHAWPANRYRLFTVLGCALLLAPGGVPAQIISTYQPSGTSETNKQWNTPDNWDSDNYPDNGQGGSYTAIIDRGTLHLANEITLDALTLNVSANEAAAIIAGGNLMTVNGTVTSRNGTFSNGQLSAGTLNITGTFRGLSGAQIEADNTFYSGNTGQLQLPGSVFSNDGAFEILTGGTITGTGGQFQNSGVFKKSAGGNVFAITQILFSDTGGRVESSDGEIRFSSGNVVLTGTTLAATNSGLLNFEATAAMNGVSINATDAGRVRFNGVLSIVGAMTSSGDGSGLIATAGFAALSGGTLNLSAEAPFRHENGVIGTATGQVVNEGHFRWIGGTIGAGGLRNDTSEAGRFLLPVAFGSRQIHGTLSNDGHITHEGGNSVVIADGGIFDNREGATLQLHANAIYVRTGTGTGVIDNDGTLVKAGAGVATISTRFINRRDLVVEQGELRLRYQAELTGLGSVAVGPGAGTPTLVLGGEGAISQVTIDATPFTFTGGLVELSSGSHLLRGTIRGTGQGLFEQIAGTAQVLDGNTATLEFAAGAPFSLNGNNAQLAVAGTLQNAGVFRWTSGTLTGAGVFRNMAAGALTVSGTATISGGAGGRLENAGDALVAHGGHVRLGEDGEWFNAADGTLRFQGNSSFGRFNNPASAELVNQGRIYREFTTFSGSSTIGVSYTQTGENAVLETNGGSITLNRDNALLGGKVISSAGTIAFTGPTILSDIAMEFFNIGTVQLSVANPSQTAHTLTGRVRGTGYGFFWFNAGTLRVPAGETGELDFAGESAFEQKGGTLEAVGVLINRGVYRMYGGSMTGTVTNFEPGSFRLDTGRIDSASFNNFGEFRWERGTIAGTFVNWGKDNYGMFIDNHFQVSSTLDVDSVLRNHGDIRFIDAARVALRPNARIENKSDAAILLEGGEFWHATSPHTGVLINEGLIRGPGSVFGIQTGALENRNGRIEVAGGVLHVGFRLIEGGSLLAADGGTLEFHGRTEAEITGTVTHELSEDSSIMYFGGRLTDGNLQSSGTGRVIIEEIDLAGSSALNGSTGAPIVIINASVVGEAVNSGNLEFGVPDSTDKSLYVYVTTGGFLNAGTASIMSHFEIEVFRVQPHLMPTEMLVNEGTVVQQPQTTLALTSQHSLFLQRFQNTGTYRMLGFSSITTPEDKYVRFRNSGFFTKDGGGLSTVSTTYFDNPGDVTVKSGGHLRVTANVEQISGTTLTGGTWVVEDDAMLTLGSPAPTFRRSSANITVRGSGVFVNLPTETHLHGFENDGTLRLLDGASMTTKGEFENNGTLEIGPGSSLTADQIDNDGAARINGTLNFTSQAWHQSGTMQGSGVVNGAQLVQAGRLAPGGSVGQLTMTGETVFAPGSVYEWEIADWAGAAGLGYDHYVSGTLSIEATEENPVVIEVRLLESLQNFDGGARVFTLVRTLGGISGFAADKFSVDASGFSAGAGSWTVGRNGNDLELIFSPAAAGMAFADWAAAHGLTPGSQDGWYDTPAGDGVPNLLKFAFAGNPWTPGMPATLGYTVVAAGNGHELRRTVPVRAGAAFTGSPVVQAVIDGIRYRIIGTDSQDFTGSARMVREVGTDVLPGLPVLDAGWEYRSFAVDLDAAGAFIRIEITPLP